MKRARVLTPWTGDGSAADPFRPQVVLHHTLTTLKDVTGQAAGQLAPAPNLLAVEVTCAAAALDALEADSRYLVLWSENA